MAKLAGRQMPQVCLVNMPFGPLVTPSLALSNFKPILERNGISVSVRYENIAFAKAIGLDLYHLIASGLPRAHDLVGEFIFSGALNQSPPDIDRYLDYLGRNFDRKGRRHSDEAVALLLERLPAELEMLCNSAKAFVVEVADRLCACDCAIAGFTSAFQQHTASLAVAAELQRRGSAIATIIGGSNCEGEMGVATLEHFPFLSAVVSGESEAVIVPLIEYLLGTAEAPAHSGVFIRGRSPRAQTEGAKTRLATPAIKALSELPVPDFSDFVRTIHGLALPEPPRLLFETSRGCWWGEKHHCTFCGLNGLNMQFRSKDGDIALKQLLSLAELYPDFAIGMTDNIMDHRYFSTFLPALKERNASLNLFYELKANIKKEQLSLIAECGITRIQPGVESLSTPILRTMEKGTTGLQNLQLLKWCLEFGIKPEWNFLWGFPGEQPQAYEAMAAQIPALTHLQPPVGVGRLRLDRFSPYFSRSSEWFVNVRPFEAYTIVYGHDTRRTRQLAYFFDYDYQDGRNVDLYTQSIREALIAWRDRYPGSFLTLFPLGESSVLTLDTRQPGHCRVDMFNGVQARILLAGDRINAVQHLTDFGDDGTIGAALEHLQERQLVAVENDRYLTLAARRTDVYPPRDVLDALRLDVANRAMC